MLAVKDAIEAAKAFAKTVLNDEGITNLGLEEIEHSDDEKLWRVTLGFSRPWNSVRNSLTALTGEQTPRRAYRIFEVSDDGNVLAMKRRPELEG